MAKRTTDLQRLTRKLDTLNDAEIREVLDFVSIMETLRQQLNSRSSWNDDLVAGLAEAYENKRARQAYEWEAVRRRAERRASALLTLSDAR